MVASADATNLSIENVIREFLKRGHYIEVYGPFVDYKSIRMFIEMGLAVTEVNELTLTKINAFDIAFCGTDAMKFLRWADIYVFNYNFIFINSWASEGSDFMFTICNERKMKKHEDCASMPIGNPKNEIKFKDSSGKKQILYVDAGHMPFGEKGKLQVANMLLEICNKYPEYNIVVKPRWLLSDKENITHRNENHIYKILYRISPKGLPTNLIMLNEHKNLQELISESISVITTSYSVYLDVALQNKGVLIVGGLDCEDKYEIRTNVTVKEMVEIANETGCYIDYREIADYLPNGILCSEKHLEELIPYRNNSAGKIVDVIEWVYTNFLCQGKFPKNRKYSYDNYKAEIQQDDTINFDYLKRKRLKNALLNATRSLDWVDADINFDPCFRLIDERVASVELNEYSFDVILKELDNLKKEIIIKNKKEMMKDSINQSILFQAWYDTGEYGAFSLLNKEDILAERSYSYYMGLIQEKYGLVDSSLKYLVKYLTAANECSYDKYLQDTLGFRYKAYISLIQQYNGSNVKPEIMFNLCKQLKKSRYYKLPINILEELNVKLTKLSVELLEKNMQSEALICLSWSLEDVQRQLHNQNTIQRLLEQMTAEIIELKQPYLLRKIKAAGRCLRGQGLIYTIKRMLFKVKNIVT